MESGYRAPFTYPIFSTGISNIGPPDPGELRRGEHGFTLIEVIVALIIVSVLATMIFNTTGDGLFRTARGVGDCQALFELQGEMERIVGIYKKRLTDGGGSIDLAAFRDDVIPGAYVDTDNTDYLSESEGIFAFSPSPTRLLLVTLVQGDQRIATIFSGS